MMDAAGSIITLVGFKVAAKKADEEHPFGHGRYEYISGLAVATLVLVVGLELTKNSVTEILKPTPVTFGWATFFVLTASMFLKTWMAVFNRDLGSRIGSPALKAVSADSRNDVLATGAVLFSAAVSHFFRIALDGWAGLGVALFIVYSGVGLVRETMNPLLGVAPSQGLVDYISGKITSYENVVGIHDLIVHDYGPNRRFVSAHVEMPSHVDALKSHAIIEGIVRGFLDNDNIHLIIHYEPVVTEINRDRE